MCTGTISPLINLRFPILQILGEWFGRTVICSCVKLSYDHAQSMIESPGKVFLPEELPPVSPQHSIAVIHQAVLNLHRIAQHLRKQRFIDGALRLDQVSPPAPVRGSHSTEAVSRCAPQEFPDQSENLRGKIKAGIEGRFVCQCRLKSSMKLCTKSNK